MVTPSEIHNYNAFIEHLNTQFEGFLSTPKKEWMVGALKCVDGMAASELRRLVTLDTRREYGAFFTPNELAQKVVAEMFPKLDASSIIYDSACGAGNLLLSTWDYLHKRKIIPKNDHYLLGTDIHPEFVAAAQSRLAIKRLIFNAGNEKSRPIYKDDYNIHQLDGLKNNRFYAVATHVFVNPPFNLIPVTEDVNWSKGVASAAALFIDRIIKYVNVGTTITAILPEVLRSGSRYHTWRGMVLSNCINERVKLLGQFDEYADVDVFAITLRKKRETIALRNSKNSFQSTPRPNVKQTVKDNFLVCVGPVVDNRDKHTGRRRGYIVSRGLPGWSVQTHFKQARNHTGRSFKGPFIVVKRTSRMGESQRAIATIINTPNPVYVDNHLIILAPKSGKISDCKRAIENLKNIKTDQWLNREIRCRHLTVKVVSKIPLWE